MTVQVNSTEKEALYKFLTDIVTIAAVVVLVMYCVANSDMDDQSILILVAILIGGEQLLRRYISTQIRDGVAPTNIMTELLYRWVGWTEGLETKGGNSNSNTNVGKDGIQIR